MPESRNLNRTDLDRQARRAEAEPALPTTVAIDEAAQDWFLTLADETATAADHARFAAWRDADPRHRAAYEELCALWADIGALRDATAPPPPSLRSRGDRSAMRPPPARATQPVPAGFGRRHAFGAGIAACLALLLLVATPELTTRLQADHLTGVGEQARVALPDGSVAWLNTDTAIDVDYDGDDRRIELLRGEAQFEVVPDPARPFAVHAHRGRSTALGTIFAVRRHDPQETTVTVTEGRVEVVSPVGLGSDTSTGPTARAVLTADERVAYREGAAPGPVQRAPAKALAWREGAIAIEGLPFAEALAEIDRYRPGRIVLLADTTRLEPVTARLSLNALDRGLEALAATHDLTVTRLTDYLLLIR